MRNSFTHITTLKSTPVATVFISGLSCRTESKDFKKIYYYCVCPAICGKRFGSDDEVIEEVKKYMTLRTIFTLVKEGNRSLAPCRH
jgi:hypothetical protein